MITADAELLGGSSSSGAAPQPSDLSVSTGMNTKPHISPLESFLPSSENPYMMTTSSILSASESGHLGPLHTPKISLPSPALPSAAVIPGPPETNPFEMSFANSVPDADPLLHQQTQQQTQDDGGRIQRRTSSMHLLTAAAELEQRLDPPPLSPTSFASAAPSAFSSLDVAAASFPSAMPASPDVPSTTTTTTITDLGSVAGGRTASRRRPAAPVAAKPPAQRRRETSIESFASDTSDDEKRNRFLERNRVAAQKCRKKKKERLDELRQITAEYERANEQLLGDINYYKEENFFVRTLLLENKGCPVMQQAGLAQLFESATRPSMPIAAQGASAGMQQRPFPPLTSQALRAALAGPSMFAG